MHRLGLYRAASTALGILSLTLYCIGVAHGDNARHFYIPAVLCAIAAATCILIHVLKTTVEKVVRCEMGKSRATLAHSIAEIITDELDEPDTQHQGKHLALAGR